MRASLGAGTRREASDCYVCQHGNRTVVCSSPVFHDPALPRVSSPAFTDLDSSGDHVLDSMLFFMFCSGELLKTHSCPSVRESSFLSCLQPHNSEIASWKHQTIAHLPVHTPTLLARLKRCHSEDHTKRVSAENLCASPPGKLSLCGKTYLLQQAIIHCLHAYPDPSGRSSPCSVSTLLCFNKTAVLPP
ncbi:hypothetical protein CHARACLAT_016849 [Characodon lateralis]|uniref:Uncharacterized protein n=1 Tax=Characodon lateralis TaxID=208331 RepID=A0ABU7CNX5_9TELE|nr:hypothetical protein [Characodon lateralis]